MCKEDVMVLLVNLAKYDMNPRFVWRGFIIGKSFSFIIKFIFGLLLNVM